MRRAGAAIALLSISCAPAATKPPPAPRAQATSTVASARAPATPEPASPCRVLARESVTRAELARFEAAAKALDRVVLAEIGRADSWLGTVARAHAAAKEADPALRKRALRELERLTGERGALEFIPFPASRTAGSVSGWELAPLERGALLTTGFGLARVTDAHFRPRLQASSGTLTASADGAWAAVAKGERVSVFHASSGTEVLILKCEGPVARAAVDPARVTLDVAGQAKPALFPLFAGESASSPAATAQSVPAPARDGDDGLPPGIELPELATEDTTVIVRLSKQVIFFDIVKGTVRTFPLEAPRAGSVQVLAAAGMAVVSDYFSGKLVHFEPPQSTSLFQSAPGEVPRARTATLSPSGHFIAVREPRGTWNGEVKLYSIERPTEAIRSFAQLGVVFFDVGERFYFIAEEDSLLYRYDPNARSPVRRVLEAPLESILGVVSSSRTAFLAWKGLSEGSCDVAVSLGTNELKPHCVAPAASSLAADFRLTDLSRTERFALHTSEAGNWLQDGGGYGRAIEAVSARFLPATDDLVLVTHTGAVEVRTQDGELRAQLMATAGGIILRTKTLWSQGSIDLNRLVCRVGRHFAPPELCLTGL